MSATEFIDRESEYFRWLAAHPHGFVINTRRIPDNRYLVLHRASCGSIRNHRGMSAAPGGFTTRGYIKICADEVSALSAWVRTHGRPDGTFSKACSRCRPS